MASTTKVWQIISSRFFLGIALVALGLIGFSLIKGGLRQREVAREIAALKADIATYEAKQQELDRLMAYFNTPEFAEREARLKLGLKKPCEEVVVVPNLAGFDQFSEADDVPGATGPNWLKWFNYFFTR